MRRLLWSGWGERGERLGFEYGLNHNERKNIRKGEINFCRARFLSKLSRTVRPKGPPPPSNQPVTLAHTSRADTPRRARDVVFFTTPRR